MHFGVAECQVEVLQEFFDDFQKTSRSTNAGLDAIAEKIAQTPGSKYP
jgi:hypothetical protein